MEAMMLEFGPRYQTKEEHDRRLAVPGPYYAVATSQDDQDVGVVEIELLYADRSNEIDCVTMSRAAVESIERILAAYKATLHVSGAPDRVYTNDATVRAAVDALNRLIS